MADGAISIETTLRQRDEIYGSFDRCAEISQRIKHVLRSTPGWIRLDDDMKEALEMDAVKTARILNGDCDIVDHWHDKAGYARLVEKRLVREAGEAFDPDEVD